MADVDATKRQAALEAGASAAVDPPTRRAEEPARQNGGMFSAIILLARRRAPALAYPCCAKADACSWSACSADRSPFRCPPCRVRAISIIGVFTGTLPEFQELMALAREGKVKPAPIETRPLATAQQSLDDLRAGHVRGRIVLTA